MFVSQHIPGKPSRQGKQSALQGTHTPCLWQLHKISKTRLDSVKKRKERERRHESNLPHEDIATLFRAARRGVKNPRILCVLRTSTSPVFTSRSLVIDGSVIYRSNAQI